MKRLLLSLLFLILALPAKAEPNWLTYDANRRIPFLSNSSYTRAEFDWWILNTGETSDLYLNGVYQSSEHGTNDIGLIDAWAVHYGGGAISVIDPMSSHALRIKEIAAKVSGAETRIYNVPTLLQPGVIAAAISNRVSVTYPIIVITTGFSYPDESLSNACRYAESRGAFIVCPVPNKGLNIDVTPDYPASWARWITSIVPVTSTDRSGNLYGPNAAAYGEYVIGAPGRNIVASGMNGVVTYSSGTSYAAPIVAGCLSLLRERYPGQTLEVYRNALWSRSDPATGTRRINAAALLATPP